MIIEAFRIIGCGCYVVPRGLLYVSPLLRSRHQSTNTISSGDIVPKELTEYNHQLTNYMYLLHVASQIQAQGSWVLTARIFWFRSWRPIFGFSIGSLSSLVMSVVAVEMGKGLEAFPE